MKRLLTLIAFLFMFYPPAWAGPTLGGAGSGLGNFLADGSVAISGATTTYPITHSINQTTPGSPQLGNSIKFRTMDNSDASKDPMVGIGYNIGASIGGGAAEPGAYMNFEGHYYSNAACTALNTPSTCCTGAGTGTCVLGEAYLEGWAIGATAANRIFGAYWLPAYSTLETRSTLFQISNYANTKTYALFNSDAQALQLYRAIDSANGQIHITNSVADVTTATYAIKIYYLDDGDADAGFIAGYDNAYGDLKFSIGADGDAVFGNVSGKVPMISKSADYTLGTDNAREAYGYTVWLSGSNTVLTLPAVVAGMRVCVYSTDASTKYIDPNASDGIRMDAARDTDGHRINSAGAIGNFACLVGDSADGWTVMEKSGTWTPE